MLLTLDIRDVLIIDRLSLAFQPGLNVLTGETGAGKSILLDALGLVLGWRGRADLVRQGAAQGEVEAVFRLPPGHAARSVLQEAGLPVADDLVLRRVSAADGRKTAWVNDRRTSGETLRALSDTLVELHGQHDDRGLLNPRGHRALLDAFAGADAAPVRAAWTAQAQARRALAEAEAALSAARTEEDFLRHAVAELDRLSPEPGEDAALDTRRRAMQGAARIRGDVARALDALGMDGAGRALTDALRWLEAAADRAEGRLEAPVAALNRALIELAEAEAGVESCLGAMDDDPRELERVEERLFAIRAMARKHGVAPDDLAGLAGALRDRLAAIDGGARGLTGLRQAEQAAAAAYDLAAASLSTARAEAAARLDMAMAEELAPLKMERARFSTVVAPGEPGPEGADMVTFTVATNPGAPPGPLDRIASGGELSRFLLALKVCLAGQTPGLTMIFDEIDRGVGGATAAAVGRRLAALAQGAQVLVVTHSPQVAALGAHHWRVEKHVDGDMTTSTVVPLDPAARVEEIARMLAGDTVSGAAREAARVLLDG
ncbi:MAG: DNA repair protein RecN [Paracoccaceae bacterium]|nr:MAG: DNA repair protein RecN [Paracoccaceae bacterium]